MREFQTKLKAFLKKHLNKRVWRSTLTVLACAVVFCTVYSIMLPAITLSTSQDTVCGIEQHKHTDACYEIAGIPAHDEICCDINAHIHNEKCYDGDGKIICGYDDKVIHQHNEFCFDEAGNLICQLPEYEGEYHVHSKACYNKAGQLTCGKLETVAHQHTEECVCHMDAVAPQNLICDKEEHTHTDACFELKSAYHKKEVEAAAPSTKTEGLEMKKTLRLTEDGNYVLRLETYVTGETVIVERHIPQDVAIILDVSGSMDGDIYISGSNMNEKLAKLDTEYGSAEGMYCYDDDYDMRYYNGKWQYNDDDWFGGGWTDLKSTNTGKISITKINSLKLGVYHFLDQLKADGEKYNVSHRVSIVKFASDFRTNKYEVGNKKSSGENYSQIVKNMTVVNADNIGSLKTAVGNLTAGGATRTDHGMELGDYTIQQAKVAGDGRQRFMVLFTDGSPTKSSSFSNDVANAAIGTAKTFKEAGGNVYSIGCLADSSEKENVKKFLNYVSSNYIHASSMDSSGTKNTSSTDYYLNVVNTEEMSDSFKTVVEELARASIELGPATQLRDGITEHYNIVEEGGKWNVAVWTESYKGSGTWQKDSPSAYAGVTVDADIPNKKVTVSGFDYSENFVCDSPLHGKKIVVEIPIAYAAGSGDLPTNTPDSGIYVPDENGNYSNLNVFVQPKVEQPAEVKLSLTTKNYAINGPYAFTIKNVLTTKTYDKPTDTEAEKVDLIGFTNYDLNLSKGDTSSIYYARDDVYDGTVGNNDHPVKIYFKPTANYNVSMTLVDSKGAETYLTLKTDGDSKYVEFMPNGNVEIKIVEDFKEYADLTIKPVVIGSSDTTQLFHYVITYVDYDGNDQTLVKDIANGGSFKFEGLPKGKQYKIVESNYQGYTVEYRDAEDASTLITGDTYTITSLNDDTTLIVRHNAHVTLPKTGSSGELIVFAVGGLMITASLSGLAVMLVKRKKQR